MIIVSSSLSAARERYKALMKGKEPPPPTLPKIRLTVEEDEAMLDMAARMFAKLYKKEIEEGKETL
ncbi:MAG: hypothetical protein NC084_13495 [Bacteroides sp.]|nr:hypothetical protein [Eubacterium sp.]MCM1419735.1 hypothetical protein [Roseburia sp.]MCM1463710.1 hypothetical protein [Bacteroides sp.]